MKAVNLIPQEGRKAAHVTKAGPVLRGGAGAYIVLAGLAVAVVLAGMWALSDRQLSQKQAELARVQQSAQAVEATVTQLAPYTRFAALSASRTETIRGLVTGRMDWSQGLHEIARVIPRDVDLTSLVGTASPASTVEGGGGDALRSALPVPAISLVGCAPSQARVAELLARLRTIDGVQRVSLSSSEKADGASANESDCRSTSQQPQFTLTVFFKARPGIVPSAAATAAAGNAAPASASTGGAK